MLLIIARNLRVENTNLLPIDGKGTSNVLCNPSSFTDGTSNLGFVCEDGPYKATQWVQYYEQFTSLDTFFVSTLIVSCIRNRRLELAPARRIIAPLLLFQCNGTFHVCLISSSWHPLLSNNDSSGSGLKADDLTPQLLAHLSPTSERKCNTEVTLK